MTRNQALLENWRQLTREERSEVAHQVFAWSTGYYFSDDKFNDFFERAIAEAPKRVQRRKECTR